MSNHLLEACINDTSRSSGKPSNSHQSRWMSHSTQLPYKQGSLITPHSQTFCKQEGLHHKQKRLRASLSITSDIPRYIIAQNFRKETSDIEPICSYESNSQNSRKRNRSSMLLLATNEDLKSSGDDAEDPRKYENLEKYSAILVHERNGFSAILSRNQSDPPLFSNFKTANRSFLITKQTGADLSKGDQIVQESTRNGGVKIQLLWSSTDSEKDNLGDASTPKGDRSCELSGETDTMDTVALSNKNEFSGVLSSPLVKRNMRDNTLHTASVDPQEDKARGKLPVKGTPDTSSMDGMEPSTSRTHSLDAEHLQEEPSSRCNKECSLIEPSSSTWVKRLKPSSLEVGESSSQDKRQCKLSPEDEELLISTDQSMMGPTMNEGESLSTKSKDTIFQCSWIQRWCQDHTVGKRRNLRREGVVEKKQFPSIGAMALMGKSMNGFRPCKLTKRGPLVIWNTEDK